MLGYSACAYEVSGHMIVFSQLCDVHNNIIIVGYTLENLLRVWWI